MTEPKADGKRSIFLTADIENFKPIFDTLMHGMAFAGGDGDVALFLRYHDYKEVAELFKNYEERHYDGSMHKMTEVYHGLSEDVDKKTIMFYRMNESITIGQYDKDTFDIKHIAEMVIIH